MKQFVILSGFLMLFVSALFLGPGCGNSPSSPAPTPTPQPGHGFDTSWPTYMLEGLAIYGTTLYGTEGSGAIDSSDLSGGTTALFATVPGGNNYGVAVDGSGNVYATDGIAKVYKYPPAGGSASATFGTTAGSSTSQLNSPYGLCVDGSGNVYIADSANSRILKLDSTLSYAATFDGSGSGAAFTYAYDVKVHGSNLYVMDFGGTDNRVVELTTSGTYVRKWGTGSTGMGHYQFKQALYLALDSLGNVYVGDGGNDRVVLYDPNGNYLSEWGGHGSGNSQFGGTTTCSSPLGMAVDSSGKIYVADSNCASVSIKVFGP